MISRPAVLAAWALVGAAAVATQVLSAVSRGSRPGIGAVLARATDRRWVSVVLVVGWMWFGWHTFAR